MIALVAITLAIVAIAVSIVSAHFDDLDREQARYEQRSHDRLMSEIGRRPGGER